MHNVSANGYAWGYIGSCIPFVVCLVLYILGSMVFPQLLGLAFSICCLLTAAWWFIFTLPLYKNYKQTHFLPKPEKPIRATFARLGGLFKDFKKYKKVFFFLFAFFFYIDGVHTIITMAMSIGSDLQFENFGAVKLVIALFITQLVACPFAILFGKLTSKHPCEKMLIVNILAYFCIGVFAVFLRQEWQFWVMAVGVGMFQGGVQALSRSYFTKIIPAEMSGEFFGLYDIFGKSAAILGTGLISLLCIFFPLAEATWINIALLPLPTLFLIGLILFLISTKIPLDKSENDEE
jgi:UMF1 family MFS transporter